MTLQGILKAALAGLAAPSAPARSYSGGPRAVSPNEAQVTKSICLQAATAGCQGLWTNLDPSSVAPAVTKGTYRGAFSRRSFDVSWSATASPSPDEALEVKVLPNENSGGWQTVRGFVGSAFVAAVDASKAATTKLHSVLVVPESEFQRMASLQRLVPTSSTKAKLILEPCKATSAVIGFDQVMDASTGVITPSTKGMVGAMFAKFPSHGKSFVGLYRRPGVLEVDWDVTCVVGGAYRAVIYTVARFSAQIQWPGAAASKPLLEEWWP